MVKYNRHTVLLLATGIYVTFFVIAFDALHGSVLIPSIALTGLCGGLFGPWAGIGSIPAGLLLHVVLLQSLSGTAEDMLLTFNPTGIILALTAGISAGLLKASCDRLDDLRTSLSARFERATAEYDQMVRTLIERDDRARIQIGQDLHDGVGQYLTSMLLHSEALHEQLAKTNQAEAGLAAGVTRRIERTIQTVRQLSRSLLPIRFSDTDLETALREMTAYFNEFSRTGLSFSCRGDSSIIPSQVAHQIHQILHEALYRAICKCKAEDLAVQLIITGSVCKVRMNGRPAVSCSDFISDIMQYRIGLIGADHVFTVHAEGGFSLSCEAMFQEEVRR